MTPERVARSVARWVRFYTRNLPPDAAERRVEELDADLHDHIAHERAHGVPDRRIALSIVARMLRGMPADAVWRRRSLGRNRVSYGRVLLVTACILLVPFVGMQLSDGVAWSIFDFVFAGLVLAGSGLLLELMLHDPRRTAYRAVATAVAVACIVLGQADDAPGLVLIGCLLILGTVALAVRTALRSE